jgi:molybdopterin biosynthesis enzyme
MTKKVHLVVTGSEVFTGRIKDGFGPVVARKVGALGSTLESVKLAPDDPDVIAGDIRAAKQAGADIILVSGGMSVDPDDVTRFAIRNIGTTDISYGAPVLPGAMFLVGYLPHAECEMANGELEKTQAQDGHSESIPILGIPACGMYHAITILDLVLPRVLAGEKIGRKELAELGHGGLCLHCKECRYPVCPFGK